MSYEYSEISFPLIKWILNPDRTISIGRFSIHIYGILIALGLMLAVVYAWKRCKQFGIREDDLTDGVLWIVPFAVVCARLYYCIFQWSSYKDNPISILYIWQGGLAIYGGVIGAAIGVVIHCKFKKIKIPALLDLVALGFLIGQCVGRWGNFFNQEAYGCNTDLPWGMTGDIIQKGVNGEVADQLSPVHPTFLYESLWCLLGALVLHVMFVKMYRFRGQIFASYLIWYGAERAVIEGLRSDSLMIGSVRVSQIVAILAVAIGATLLVLLPRSDKERARVLAAQSEEDEAVEESDPTPLRVETLTIDAEESLDGFENENTEEEEHGNDY